MLRPKRMSKVSVTGSNAVMGDVIEAVHGLNLVHLSDYDGRWGGFDNGDPMTGAEAASEKLVTVRSLKSILGITDDDAGPSRILDDEALAEELEEIRVEANELDDRRNEIEDGLRDVEERLDAMAPFAELGIDLDLLYGYDSLAVVVGEGDADAVERALADLDAPAETFAEGGVVAAFARTDEETLQQAAVDADLTALAVPDGEGDPEDYYQELRHEKQKLESELTTVEDQLEDLKYDAAGFLLAAEEKLSVEVQKAEAPLNFATTRNAFVAEGWLPSERVDDLEAALADAVGDRVDVDLLEVAKYDRHGHAGATEEMAPETEMAGPAETEAPGERDEDGTEAEEAEPREARADGGERSDGTRPSSELRSDGGTVTMDDEGPPVVQDNPGTIKPFELLTRAVGRPSYSEFDPTILLFLTFPLMFGFIIGDLGYGVIYTAIGYYIYANYDSETFRNLGVITMAAGVATAVFGVLYGEIFGLHLIATHLWDGVFGLEHAPIQKGLSPATGYWARAWFVVSVLFGILHLNTAYVLEFVEGYSLHGAKEAVIESGSWLLALNGLWLFIFARPPTVTEGGETVFVGPKPDFIYQVFGSGAGAAFDLGFTGVPPVSILDVPLVGTIPFTELLGVVMILAGAGLLAIGPAHELIELHVVLAHALSYLRIAAVLLAKAGMAFAVNLLFFGAYQTDGEFHYMLAHGPNYVQNHYEEVTIIFGGMYHGGPALLAFGVLVLLVGHLIVLILGVTSSGIQSIRLEYFEFFEKFYEGNGTPYSPFGVERRFTDENQ